MVRGLKNTVKKKFCEGTSTEGVKEKNFAASRASARRFVCRTRIIDGDVYAERHGTQPRRRKGADSGQTTPLLSTLATLAIGSLSTHAKKPADSGSSHCYPSVPTILPPACPTAS